MPLSSQCNTTALSSNRSSSKCKHLFIHVSYNTRESPLYRNAMLDALVLLESGWRKHVFIGINAYGSSSGRAPAASRASSLQVAASSKHLGSQPADFARSAIQSGAFGRKRLNMPLIAWVGFKGICLIFSRTGRTLRNHLRNARPSAGKCPATSYKNDPTTIHNKSFQEGCYGSNLF